MYRHFVTFARFFDTKNIDSLSLALEIRNEFLKSIYFFLNYNGLSFYLVKLPYRQSIVVICYMFLTTDGYKQVPKTKVLGFGSALMGGWAQLEGFFFIQYFCHI